MSFKFNPFTGNLDYFFDETGVNTGDVTLAAIGSSPNANGASLSGQQLQLQPANASFGGVVTTSAQTFVGDKTFNGKIISALGAAATPNYTFNGDTDTGIFSSGANSISISGSGNEWARFGVSNSGYFNFGGNFTATNAGFTINGLASNVVTFCLRLANSQSANLLELYTYAGSAFASITKDGYMLLPSGSGSGSAAYGFFGDSNTGLFSTGADSFSGTTGGSERFRILSGGQLNVGANFTATSHTLLASTVAVGTPTLGVKAITSQTADLFQATNSSGTPLTGITVAGRLYVGSNGIPTLNTSNSITSLNDADATLGLSVRSSGTQTADIISIFNSAGTKIAILDVSSYLYLPNGSLAAPSYTFYADTKYGMTKNGNYTELTSEEKYLGVDKNGNVNCVVHNNATAYGTASTQEIRSGSSVTPTFTNVTEISSVSLQKLNFKRVGNEVTVSGIIDLDTVNSGVNCSFEMSLPIASQLENIYNLAGAGVVRFQDKAMPAVHIKAEVTNDTALFEFFSADVSGSTTLSFIFQYEVLG